MKSEQQARRLVPAKSVILLLMVGAFATGCGKGGSVKNLVTNLEARVKTQGDDLYADVSAQINSNVFSMASFVLPIVNPNNPAVSYGSISLSPNLGGGGGRLAISVNVSEAASIPSVIDATLPNGTVVPISLPSGVSLIAIPVGNHGAKIYLALSKQTLMVGTAIPFNALDGVGQYVPGVNVFAPLKFGQVSSLVGIFAGSGAYQTGIGVFADLSSILPVSTQPEIIALSGEAAGLSEAQRSNVAPLRAIPVRFRAPRVSKYTEQQMYYHLWKASQKSRNPVLKYE